jgi:Uma2 family endonuclease
MSAAKKVSLEEWSALDEDDARELVRGALEEGEVPDRVHELVVAWLVAVLGPWARRRGGFVFASGLKLVVRKDTGRMADVVCYLRGRRPDDGVVRSPPDVVVEVISPRPRDARRDRVEKLADYAEMGAKQYWLVDPRLRTFEVWKLDRRRRYVCVAAASRGTLAVGPTLDLDALWAEVKRLERRGLSSA